MRRIRGKEIGAIFQDPLTSLNPLYTIGHQLVETIRTHLDHGAGGGARPCAVVAAARSASPAPSERIDHYPHQFSGGMRQRVVIALALAANPRLIIADEPTTALDVSIQAQIIALLKRLGRDHGTAIMLVTHDMGVIAETAHRVAVMYAGRIVEIGPVRAIVDRPSHPYTIGLMGSIPRIAGAARPAAADRRRRCRGLNAIPPGCPFNPRCPEVFDRCRRERPDLMPAGDTEAACWLHAPVASPRMPERDVILEVNDLERVISTFRRRRSNGCCTASRASRSRRSTASASRSGAARPSRWSASRAAASRRWRGASSGSIARRPGISSSTGSISAASSSARRWRRSAGACR